jgi:uncharacterized membrane protein
MVALAILLAVGVGTIGGVFFAFSAFIMQALAELRPSAGIAAMQRINAVILNPLFLGVFIGTALLSLAVIVLYVVRGRGSGAGWLLAAGLFYLVGSFAVTMRCNVPRNERLARLNADTAEAAAYWPTYVREWTAWNHLRACACLAAAVCAIMAAASN